MCCAEIQKAFNAQKECFSEKVTSATGEHGRQFLIELPKGSSESFCLIKVDKYLITNAGVEKCDFVFRRCGNSDFYFIECKGRKIKKAFSQIVATIGHFQVKFTIGKPQIYGFIVASEVRSPKNNAEIQNLKKEFANKHGVALRIESNKLIHRLT
ncbi:MAG: hypothetical protein DYG98_05600 [Haliscomenobacteraceae bacterium CHB4]|nr:hypothetical protein [Haliscomenobacteraceae bacterium CHB4]